MVRIASHKHGRQDDVIAFASFPPILETIWSGLGSGG